MSKQKQPPLTPVQSKTRADRPLAVRVRGALASLLKCPSKSVHLRTSCERTTQTRFLKDIFIVMDVLVSQMCFGSRKVGVTAQNGFFLFTWSHVAQLSGLPEWRVKRCFIYLRERGWVTSEQPFTLLNNNLIALPSIKIVTTKFFKDLGLMPAYKEAFKAARIALEKRAVKLGKPLRIILTPISLLKEIRQRQHAGGRPPDVKDEVAAMDNFAATC